MTSATRSPFAEAARGQMGSTTRCFTVNFGKGAESLLSVRDERTQNPGARGRQRADSFHKVGATKRRPIVHAVTYSSFKHGVFITTILCPDQDGHLLRERAVLQAPRRAKNDAHVYRFTRHFFQVRRLLMSRTGSYKLRVTNLVFNQPQVEAPKGTLEVSRGVFITGVGVVSSIGLEKRSSFTRSKSDARASAR